MMVIAVEFVRRLLLLVCTFAAILLLNMQTPVLIWLEQVDFAHELKITPFPWEHKGQTAAEFAREKTSGLTMTLSDNSWQKIRRFVQQHPKAYLKTDAEVIEAIAGKLTPDMPQRYLKGKNTPQQGFIRIQRLTPENYWYSLAPYGLRHPCRWCSPVLLLIAVLLYIYLPWRKFDSQTLSYSGGFSAVYGVDLVAWMISSGFFALGLGVGLSGTDGGIPALFSSHLIVITAVLWLFMLFGFYMFRIAAVYAGTGLRCQDKRLIRYRPSGKQQRLIADIDSVRMGRWKPSKWVTRLGFLVSLLNWRALGPTLLNSSRSDPRLEIHFKQGKPWIFSLTGAKNVQPLLHCLEKNGIKIPASLK